MKVNPISTVNNQNPRSNARAVNFGASIPAGAAGAAKKMPWLARALMYVGQNDGEILNTLVTAGGTAIIAPIFIAGNPLSKEDKETKWYSAMRQPISAVIAMIMQIGVNSVYNKYMNQMASLGKFGKHMDLRAKPIDSYLRRIIELEKPGLTPDEMTLEINKRQCAAQKVELRKLREAMKDKEITLQELINSDSLEEAKNQMTRELEEQYQAELKGKSKKKAEEFLKRHLTDEKVKARALQDLERDIKFETEVKFEIRKLKERFKNIEGSTLDDAISAITKNPDNLDKDVLDKIVKKLEETKIYEQANNRKPFSTIPDFVGEITKENVEKNVKIKKLLKVKVSDAKKFFGKHKNIIGICVSLVTLPISCGLLNWAYPRIMEKVMPKLQPWIHRNDPDWTPEKAKKYGPPEKVEAKKVKEEEDDDGED